MISDESSSDSETGRFKCSETKPRPKSNDHEKDLKFGGRSSGRGRLDNDRFRRDFDRRRGDRDRVERRSKDRLSNRSTRHSPARRRSRERSRDRSRRSRDRPRSRDKEQSSRPKPAAPPSKAERRRISPPRVPKSPTKKKDYRDEERPGKFDRGRSRDKSLSLSPDQKVKRSVVQKPVQEAPKPKVESPIPIDDHESEDEVQAGSYYSMIPAVVKEKSVEREKTEESSEIDSSDDERLRAKLLNLEKELSKTRKKKHRKKHKKKSAKSKDKESDVSVEVSSTTDIGKDTTAHKDGTDLEVSSTQKVAQKDSSEEGEISSDDNSKGSVTIDATDLRHRLKRSQASETSGSPDLRDRLKTKLEGADVCGPALPPHLEKRFRKSVSPGAEGPALPAHLTRTEKNIGPTIPQDMRKALAEAEMKPIKLDSSDDDGIGPLPVGAEQKWTNAHKQLEERALDIKIKKMDGNSRQNDVKSREKWMLELPEGKAKILGLEARSFRAKEGPDMSDRSSWTDTPEEKARKASGAGAAPEDTAEALAEDAHARILAKRDEEQERAAKKHKKKHKREESLLDIHQKKLKKKKKKDDKDEKSERRPFSRDVDLQVNRFDEAQKKSIIKKAQELDTRFSKGQAKYL